MSDCSGSLLAFRKGQIVTIATQLRPRKKPRQERAKATTEAILAAAAQVLVEEGYEASSTNRIAARAGVSIGSLYQYFPTKEAIVYTLMKRHMEKMQELLFDSTAQYSHAPMTEAVPAYVKAMLAAHRVEPGLHRVIAEQLPRIGGYQGMKDSNDAIFPVIRAYLELHKKEIRNVDLDTLTFTLIHAVEGVTHVAVLERPKFIDWDVLAEELSRLVLRYLLKDVSPVR
jgi:AcrR family transcriptional regulator